ncbi:hypothetical protein BKA70DRAFT_1144339 [Coprinopsis sp. MPI-PUGE-AT-0042]|nr:hypothetical protein BKA70DRAFT_1144339 [Coprinopsis sp. MPI-PUGE-AT-0042]
MGAVFSTWARWDDTVVQQVLASEAQPNRYYGPAIIQGAQNVTISGGVFNLSNQQGVPAQDRSCVGGHADATATGNPLERQEGTPAQDPERLRKALDFLSLVNFRSIQQENLGKWTPGTIKWLLESRMFRFWLDTQCAILWGTGMPGAGKTVLASVVIKHSEDLAEASSDICVAFVYCRYTEPMKVRDILAALVRQLLERFPHLLPVVEPLYTKHNLQKTEPTQGELINVIRKICSCFRIAYLFIDGLDEALYDEQFDLLDTLKSVPANFFITSRPLVRLKDVLPNVEFFDIAAQNRDIEILVSQQINRNPDLQQVLAREEQRAIVVKKICQSSHGMFLHASLMVEAVRHCTNSRQIMEKLNKLPPKLDVLYDEAFERIEMQPEEHAALAKCVLLWVAYAYRSLTVDDLRYAVASNPSVDWKAPENLVPESLLVSVCCGLITVEDSDSYWGLERTVRFVHYTALDAVKRILERKETAPHRILAELCAEQLMDCGDRPMPRATEQSQWLVPEHKPPLLRYARIYWLPHARESIWLFSQPAPSTLRFLAMGETFSPKSYFPGDFWENDNPTAPIHLVVSLQLPNLLPFIYSQVNEQTRKGRSALSLAAWDHDVVMAKLLLKLNGIDVNLQDKDGNTALMHAAGKGLLDVLKVLLLDPRIDPHIRNEEGKTALHCALLGKGYNYTKAAMLLIASPWIEINAADNHGRTPLMLASTRFPTFLDSLQALHPNIDLLKNKGLTPHQQLSKLLSKQLALQSGRWPIYC